MHPRPARVMRHGRETYETAYSGRKGFLDYIALRPPRVIIAELKDAYSKMSPEQEEWFKQWEECQHTIVHEPMKLAGTTAIMRMHANIPILTTPEVYLWRPKDFEVILECLR